MTTQRDNRYVHDAYRHLSMQAARVSAVTCIVYTVLFYADNNIAWLLCCTLSVLFAALDAVFRSTRYFVVGIVVFFATVLTFLALAVFYIGADMGFHYPLINILPLIATGSRFGIRTKQIAAGLVSVAIVWLDYYSAVQSLAIAAGSGIDTISPNIKLLFRIFNAIVVGFTLTGMSIHYYMVVSKQQKLLLIQAGRDELTGLFNRRRIVEEVVRLELQRKRYGQFYSVMLCDLDHFKSVNDRLGHDGGDHVLKHVSQIFSAVARDTDTVGRWGGEEFLIVLPDTDNHGAMLLAKRLCEQISASSLNIDGQSIDITVTIGVATLKDSEPLESVFKRADEAMYRGKKSGRNCVVSEMF